MFLETCHARAVATHCPLCRVVLSYRECDCRGADRPCRHVPRLHAGHRTQTREDAGRPLPAGRRPRAGVLGRRHRRDVPRRGREELAAGEAGTDHGGPVRLRAGTDRDPAPEGVGRRVDRRDHEDELREADEPPRGRRDSTGAGVPPGPARQVRGPVVQADDDSTSRRRRARCATGAGRSRRAAASA